jgi:hypothetical protein
LQLDEVGLGEILAGGLGREIVAPVVLRESGDARLLHHYLGSGNDHRAEVYRQLRQQAQRVKQGGYECAAGNPDDNDDRDGNS